MRITLKSLTLTNFKGIRNLTVDFGPETDIYAANGAGKTTLYDAFLWLLFDKDSFNRKDFDIKPLDENNKVIRGLNPEVEGTLSVDGRPITLRKVYSEKWTKARGAATAEFSGHTTDYFVDGVPCKLSEYKSAVAEIADEEAFKLLTSPTYFNTVLDWKSRRKVLLEVCGDVSDADVITSNPVLAELPKILGNRSIEDHRKVIAAKRKEINDELERIPVRIDEANKSMPELVGIDEASVDAGIARLQSVVEEKESELSRLQSGGEVSVQEKRMREIEGELLDIRNRAQSGTMDLVAQQQRKVMALNTALVDIERDVRRVQNSILTHQGTAAAARAQANELRAQWAEVNASGTEPHTEGSCPTCKQSLPAEQVQAAHDQAVANFNRQKAERLESIQRDGKAAMNRAEQADETALKLAFDLDSLDASADAKQNELDEAKAELERLQAGIQDVTTNPEHIAKQGEFENVRGKLLGLRQSALDDVQRVRDEIADVRDQLRAAERGKAAFAQVRVLDARIEDLKQQERKLAAKFEELERQLNITEEFIRAKVSMLTGKINSKFQHARFKLFESQINGGLAEVCETTYGGVPYSSGLNHAARVNVGADICNTLSEHYGLTLPIWIDNRESVTDLVFTDSQVINLIVSPKDKTLRIESGLVKEAV